MQKKDSGKQKKSGGKKDPAKNTNNQENTVLTEENYSEKEEKQVEEAEQEQEIKADTLANIEMKLTEMQEKYLRLSAEFDNYRKRTLKEKTDLIKTAGEAIIVRIIPVFDDLERAVGFINGEGNVDESKEGILLIYKKLKDILTQQGLKEIEALHMDFDTDIHEAITKIPAPEKKLKGKVVDVVQKGYLLHDKVVRYAKVVIGE